MQEQPEVRPESETAPAVALSGEARSAAWACLRALGCSPEEADDLAHDAVLVLLEKQPDAANGSGLLAWARQAARYLFLTHSRTERRRAELIRANIRPEEAANHTDQEWDALLSDADLPAARSALRECIRGLDGRGRELLDLHYFHGLGAAESAQKTGRSPGAVNTALSRIRGQLRECITRRLANNK